MINERVLPDDYPMYHGYYYVNASNDEVFICPIYETTVGKFKKEFGIEVIKNCDMIKRKLF